MRFKLRLSTAIIAALLLSTSVSGYTSEPIQPVAVEQFAPVVVPSFVAAPTLVPVPSFVAPVATIRPVEVKPRPTPSPKVKVEAKIKPTPTAVNGKQPSRAKIKAWTAAKLGNSTQFACLEKLWWKESAWRWNAGHPSRAYGIPQAYPGTKMKREGADWKTNPITQVNWGLKYIKRTYGTPCAAWSHWKRAGNY